jgi:uncharacterized protein YacL
VFVEVTRLLTVLFCTALGFFLGRHGAADNPVPPLAGATLGAAVGYLAGGVGGRRADLILARAERRLGSAAAPALLAGAFGALIGGGLSALVGLPALILIPRLIAAPLYCLLVWLGASTGAQLAARKSAELLALAGLSTRPLVRATAYGADPEGDAVLVDSSAAIDGRILVLARSGFLAGPLLVPRFVLDEMQSLADAREVSRRRRGRRGLEVLDAIRAAGVPLHVLDDEMVEHHEVDAKLVALARRLRVGLLTVDEPLQRVAELQGVRCLNPGHLALEIREERASGDIVRVPIVRSGRDEGQGVGYLDDGTMVVVNDAQELVGTEVEARVTGQVRTAVGTMLFASRA